MACGVAWMPRMVLAGSPGIRWIMKNTMIVIPTATGTSISRRWNTKVIRPKGRSPSSPGRRRPLPPTPVPGPYGHLLSQTFSMCMLPSGVTKKPCTLLVVAYGYGE